MSDYRCSVVIESPGEEPGYTRLDTCNAPAYVVVGVQPFCRECFEARGGDLEQQSMGGYNVGKLGPYVQPYNIRIRTIEEYEEMVTLQYVKGALAKE